MITAYLYSLLPAFLLIALGYGIHQARILDEAFWVPAEKITTTVFFPALLVTNLARVDLSALNVLPLAAALSIATVLTTAGLIAVGRRFYKQDGPAFTSLLQGSIRFNTYVGLASAVTLFQTPGLTLAAVCIAVMLPLVVVLSIVILVRFGHEQGPTPKDMALTIIQNPMILACALGVALNLSQIGLPPVIGPLLDLLAGAALPIGLLTVGAELDLSLVTDGMMRDSVLSAAAKLIVMPLLTWGACHLFGVHGLTATVAVLFAALPGSASAYMMARQFGGDTREIAGMITIQTLIAAATMPLMLTLLR